MKRVASRDWKNSHWLLVQTHRTGTDQVAQAAWKIFPSDVDLLRAATPLDALKAFVEVFGCPVKIGDKKSLFTEADTFPLGTEVKLSWYDAPPDNFHSTSVVRDQAKHIFSVGTTYCIDLSKYRSALKARGLHVFEPDPLLIARARLRKEVRVFVNQERITFSY
jgi:hypothetical protein